MTRIVEIDALSNGAHRNQAGTFSSVPDGYAVIPETMVCENFPFGEITVDETMSPPVVTSWTPGNIPEPNPDLEPAPTPDERIAALEEENHLLSQQVTALTDQNDFQEELIVELANIVYA